MRCFRVVELTAAAMITATVLSVPPLSAQLLEQVERVAVIDANDKIVGKADLHHEDRDGLELSVIFRIGAQIFWLGIRFDGFQEPDDLLGFESTDCSGPPFLFASAGPPSLFTLVSLVRPGNTIFLPVPGSEPRQILFRSFLRRSGCVADTPNTVIAFPAQAVINLDDVFTPPFKLVAVDNNTPI